MTALGQRAVRGFARALAARLEVKGFIRRADSRRRVSAMTVRVGINGYGTIGKRVADAVAAQGDMKVVGVTKSSVKVFTGAS